MLILGIETSCNEAAAEENRSLLKDCMDMIERVMAGVWEEEITSAWGGRVRRNLDSRRTQKSIR